MSTAIYSWSSEKCEAASLLAAGYTNVEVAEHFGVHPRTVSAWLSSEEFSAEVDRLTLMIGVASRTERLRMAMRVIRSRTDENGVIRSNKDALDWLKFAQSETDGVKLDIFKLL